MQSLPCSAPLSGPSPPSASGEEQQDQQLPGLEQTRMLASEWTWTPGQGNAGGLWQPEAVADLKLFEVRV